LRRYGVHNCAVVQVAILRLPFAHRPPFPGISRHDRFIVDPDALRGTIMELLPFIDAAIGTDF
jgi:hypothetical protein